jgi:hypothetical protein
MIWRYSKHSTNISLGNNSNFMMTMIDSLLFLNAVWTNGIQSLTQFLGIFQISIINRRQSYIMFDVFIGRYISSFKWDDSFVRNRSNIDLGEAENFEKKKNISMIIRQNSKSDVFAFLQIIFSPAFSLHFETVYRYMLSRLVNIFKTSTHVEKMNIYT